MRISRAVYLETRNSPGTPQKFGGYRGDRHRKNKNERSCNKQVLGVKHVKAQDKLLILTLFNVDFVYLYFVNAY